MKVTYCRTWNQVPYDVLSIEAARRMHESRKRYEVIFEDEARALAEVDIVFRQAWCVIRYFDERRRRVHDHYWSIASNADDRLFWSGALDYIYLGDEQHQSWAKDWYYAENGRMWMREGNRHETRIREDYPRIDVSDHYEPLPAFGDFAGLYRLIRHGPPERVPAFDGNIVVLEPEPKPKAKRKPRR